MNVFVTVDDTKSWAARYFRHLSIIYHRTQNRGRLSNVIIAKAATEIENTERRHTSTRWGTLKFSKKT